MFANPTSCNFMEQKQKPLRNTNITIIKGIFNGKLLVHRQSATGNLSINVEISVVKSVILIEIKKYTAKIES